MSAPAALLEAIKDDLGITDTANDAWLQRRLDNIWSRIEHYTSRKLHSPPAPYIDDWARMVVTNPVVPLPPMWEPIRVSPFLRYFPVTSIEAIELNGASADPTKVVFSPRTGKLFSLSGDMLYAEDLSGQLYGTRTRITYKTGWDEVPGDLYEVVLGCIQPLWNQRLAAQSAGVGGLTNVSSINVNDVGSVELGGRTFADIAASSAAGGGGKLDPMLGPWIGYLDLYVDHRSLLGDALNPVTEPVAPAPP